MNNKIYILIFVAFFINACGSTDGNSSQVINHSLQDNELNNEVSTISYDLKKEYNMEDITGWTIDWNASIQKIRKVEDSAEHATVVSLDGNKSILKANEKIKQKVAFTFNPLTDDNDTKVIEWSMKTKDEFYIQLILDTKDGERYLVYTEKDTGLGKEKGHKDRLYVTHGIGSHSTDGKWHTFTRDIEGDIKRYEPTNKLLKIKKFSFYGNAKVDDVKLYTSGKEKHLMINKTPLITAPGVVLSFDDSYIEGWYGMDTFFRKHGVVATWFCYRWGSKSVPALSPNEIKNLKILESHEDEIGLHTVEHIGTRDKKFDTFQTIDEKAQAYMDQEISPAIKIMRENNFEPESFSYPYLSGQPVHNKKIREKLPHIREFFSRVIEIDSEDSQIMRENFIDEIKASLDKFKQDKEIGVFFGHRIEQKPIKHKYSMTIEDLKAIIIYAEEIGLKFYTLKEAHNIYLHQ